MTATPAAIRPADIPPGTRITIDSGPYSTRQDSRGARERETWLVLPAETPRWSPDRKYLWFRAARIAPPPPLGVASDMPMSIAPGRICLCEPAT